MLSCDYFNSLDCICFSTFVTITRTASCMVLLTLQKVAVHVFRPVEETIVHVIMY